MGSQGASLEEEGQMGQVVPEGAAGSRVYVTVAPRCFPKNECIPKNFSIFEPTQGSRTQEREPSWLSSPFGRAGEEERGWNRKTSTIHLLP